MVVDGSQVGDVVCLTRRKIYAAATEFMFCSHAYRSRIFRSLTFFSFNRSTIVIVSRIATLQACPIEYMCRIRIYSIISRFNA